MTIIEGVDVSQNSRMNIIDGVNASQNVRLDYSNTISNFGIIKVSGQPDVIANVIESEVTLVAGSNMTITTDGVSNTITFNSTGGGGGGGPTTAFSRVIISGQPDAIANIANAPLTLVAGSGITLATNGVANSITITSTGGGGATSNLTSVVDTFTGNGYTTAFNLSVTPISINYTTAVVGGVSQPRSAYSVVGTTLTFTSAPENGQIIEVTTLFGGGSNVTSAYVENSNSVILVTNTVITANCTVAANTGGLSVGPVVINTSQTVTVANNARWVIL
jgi:hypothetical protein